MSRAGGALRLLLVAGRAAALCLAVLVFWAAEALVDGDVQQFVSNFLAGC